MRRRRVEVELQWGGGFAIAAMCERKRERVCAGEELTVG